MLSEKHLDRKGKCKKINKQKPQELGDQKGERSCPVMIAEPNRKKDLLFVPDEDSANEKPWTLVYYSPPKFLFPSVKAFSFPFLLGTCTWLAMVADPFSADPE